MPLPQVECTGSITMGETTVFRECVKVKKVFDEFVLRECVEGIEFEVDECHENFKGSIEPTLILRNCTIINPQIKNASTNSEKRLRFSGKCCCQVFAKDLKGNIIRLRVKCVPAGTALSKGPNGELCFNFSVRRIYPGATEEIFNRLLHFVDQEAFELQCLSEAIIDEENNEFTGGSLITNIGIFVAIKFDAEVQLCIPVFGTCEITDECSEEEFCDTFELVDIPNFNPPQINDENPYCD
ncbi:hypothetical protein [Lutispora sp.]|uniref:hypothetical protein n=1 Tax=Lutispora sp. TaxID=2828727 RepID=UPI002B21BAB3|nr:hypothetical protein [Lutispora sp.]MEA4963484.1 hypothetical protein [Lutispora sp.]